MNALISIPADDIYRTPEEAEASIDALIAKLGLAPGEYTNRRIQANPDGWHLGWIDLVPVTASSNTEPDPEQETT